MLATSGAGSGPKRERPSDSNPIVNRKQNSNHNHNNHHQKPIFEETIYRGVVGLDGVLEATTSATTDLMNDNVNGIVSHINHDSVTLPIAVRSCWPDLFPTMSSAKKSIRKGIFFVRHSSENATANEIATEQSNGNGKKSSSPNKTKTNASANRMRDPQKGKCDTRIFVGETLLRKLPASVADRPRNSTIDDTAQQKQQQQQLLQMSQRFRTRGPSTEDIIARAIGGKLKLAYLDPHLAVVVKPHGMPVHKVLVPPPPAISNTVDCKRGTTVAANTTDNATHDNDSSKNSSRVISMHELLLHCLPPSLPGGVGSMDDPLRRPAAIHRLDRPTYGLLIVARTRPCARFLGKVFEERTETLVKRYRAIVHGHVPGRIITNNNASEKCNGDIGNDNGNNVDGNNSSNNANPSKAKRIEGTFVRSSLSGKDCLTEYFIVKKLVVVGDGVGGSLQSHSPLQLTLVDLMLHTGRKHQIRRHMASLGHPIVGDTRYGRSKDDEMVSDALVSSSSAKLLLPCAMEAMTVATNPSTTLPLMLAAVEITFPHSMGGTPYWSCSATMTEPRTTTDSSSSNNEAKYKYCVMASGSKHSFDASRRTLNVTIPMPDSMQYILRNSSSSSSGN